MTGAAVSASHDNNLTPYQIMTHMQIKLEKGVSQKDLFRFRDIVQRLDLDGNGQLNLKEYEKTLISWAIREVLAVSLVLPT